MVEIFAYSGNPDQKPHSVASDLDLQKLPITFFGVSRFQWVKGKNLLQDGTSSPL